MQHTLYVGDLAQDVTEAILYSFFSTVSPVASIRICRDYLTRQSLGYAYANFYCFADAERALETLNNTKILDRPCRLMWSHQTPNGGRRQGNGEGTIVVSNLASGVDKRILTETFRIFGKINSCKIMCDPKTGESWGYAFVHFASKTSAENAINRGNGVVIHGQDLHVTRYKSPRQRDGYRKDNFVSLYVKNFPEEWNEGMLKELAQKYGEFKDCVIQRDETGKSRGFGFINFKDTEVAKKAVVGLHEMEVSSKSGEKMKLYVARAQSKRERQKLLKEKYAAQREEEANRNLYVKGLLDSVDQEQMRAVFSSVGAITRCRVMREKNGISKGFGFVLYETEEAAHQAIKNFHSRELHGIGGPLHVAIAKKSKPRHTRFNNQMYNDNGVPPLNSYSGQMCPPWMPYESHGPPPVPNMPFGRPNPGYGFPPASAGPYAGGFQGLVPQVGHHQRVVPPLGMPFLPYQQVPYHQVSPQHPQLSYAEDQEMAHIMSLQPKEQKQLLGEKIFAAIEKSRGKIKEAGKITGMLLEMDTAALINLLHQPVLLDDKIQQATDVLRKYQESSEKAVE